MGVKKSYLRCLRLLSILIFCTLTIQAPVQEVRANPVALGVLICVGPQAIACFLAAAFVSGITVVAIEQNEILVWYENLHARNIFITTVEQNRPKEPRIPKGMDIIDLGSKNRPEYWEPIEDSFPQMKSGPKGSRPPKDNDIQMHLPSDRYLHSSDIYGHFILDEDDADIPELEEEQLLTHETDISLINEQTTEQSSEVEATMTLDDDKKMEFYTLRATSLVKNRMNYQVKFALKDLVHEDCVDYKAILEMSGEQTIQYYLDAIPRLELLTKYANPSFVIQFVPASMRCLRQNH